MFKERIYKIWKQFTTVGAQSGVSGNCVQRTNIQNLKAIHNAGSRSRSPRFIVFKERIYKIWKQFTTIAVLDGNHALLCSKNEYTKSESNSQRVRLLNLHRHIVFKERIYKIWKQFTTVIFFSDRSLLLCSKNEYTKSESNSQPANLWIPKGYHCVQRTNIQNLKAIHNAFRYCCSRCRIVFKERIYKIWKQFTTKFPLYPQK